jgi:hypothetical protein
MTPKKILSIPVYGSGTTLGVIAAILLLPGGLILFFAMCCYWLADRMASADIEDCATIHGDYECDMTIEEYEAGNGTPHRCDNCTFGDACLTAASHSCTDWESEKDVED